MPADRPLPGLRDGPVHGQPASTSRPSTASACRSPCGARARRASRSGASCGPAAGATTASDRGALQGRLVPRADDGEDRRARLLHQERGATPRTASGAWCGRRRTARRSAGRRRAPTPGSLPARMAQQLWLLRHGEAEPHDARPDADRRLTDRGREQSRVAGCALAALKVARPPVPSRAPRSARATPRCWPARPSASSRSSTPRSPPASTSPTRWSCWRAAGPDQRVLVVGHEPDFSQVVHDLTGGAHRLQEGRHRRGAPRRRARRADRAAAPARARADLRRALAGPSSRPAPRRGAGRRRPSRAGA